MLTKKMPPIAGVSMSMVLEFRAPIKTVETTLKHAKWPANVPRPLAECSVHLDSDVMRKPDVPFVNAGIRVTM